MSEKSSNFVGKIADIFKYFQIVLVDSAYKIQYICIKFNFIRYILDSII